MYIYPEPSTRYNHDGARPPGPKSYCRSPYIHVHIITAVLSNLAQ